MKYGLILTRSDNPGSDRGRKTRRTRGLRIGLDDGVLQRERPRSARRDCDRNAAHQTRYRHRVCVHALADACRERGARHRRTVRRPDDSRSRQRHQNDERKLVFDAVQRTAGTAYQGRHRSHPRRVRRAERRRTCVRRRLLPREDSRSFHAPARRARHSDRHRRRQSRHDQRRRSSWPMVSSVIRSTRANTSPKPLRRCSKAAFACCCRTSSPASPTTRFRRATKRACRLRSTTRRASITRF